MNIDNYTCTVYYNKILQHGLPCMQPLGPLGNQGFPPRMYLYSTIVSIYTLRSWLLTLTAAGTFCSCSLTTSKSSYVPLNECGTHFGLIF